LSRDGHDWKTLIEAHDAFWRGAGVDLSFEDETRDWLAEAAPASDAPPPLPKIELAPKKPLGPAAPEMAPVAPAGEGLPETLEQFAPWWLADPALDTGPLDQRVAPRGKAGAPLMLIVAEPEAGDGETLLSGREGALFDAIERAMGYAPGEVYRASALPRMTPAADWAAISAAGMGAVLRHHVQLVAPERLLVLSREALAVLSPDRLDADGTGMVDLGGRQIPLIAAFPLAKMGPRPGSKKIFWKRWLAFASGH